MAVERMARAGTEGKRYYAHTRRDSAVPGGAPIGFEPLFTPFGGDPEIHCVAPTHYCSRCVKLEKDHGHVNKVAWWAAKFAGEMFPEGPDRDRAFSWGYLAGFWHDLGKFSDDFQRYLLSTIDDCHEAETRGRVDHSSAGAQAAVEQVKVFGHLLAYPIAGHHSGLLNAEGSGSQRNRLAKEIPALSMVPNLPREILGRERLRLPKFLENALRDPKAASFAVQFFTRMLFSCLVDADFLATERFMSPTQAAQRSATPERVLRRIEELVTARIREFGPPHPDDVVNSMRARVVADCVAAASRRPGLFTLTVPTGGGKTLSSLVFALRHALEHGQRRVIYVAPFTSIIEQNANVFRSILRPLEEQGLPSLIEHHSALAPERETVESRLAAENWDAPIIVTTAVQFYESFFAAKTSRSRKLHNVANAVVILDEAQTLPVSLLSPCLGILRELTTHYGTTVVLCTATQPAIGLDSEHFPIGLDLADREIISDTAALFSALKRVHIQNRGEVSDTELIEDLQRHGQALCIVNRRQHAQRLFRMLGEGEGNFHLSALMCPAHRTDVLAAISERLAGKLPTRVISTQVVEAGVDLDFPVVYRALAGVDSIAQAAGRCNRHGTQATTGKVLVFKPEDTRGETYFRDTAQIAAQVLELEPDLLSEKAIRRYFELYYFRNKSRWDEKRVLDRFEIRPGNRDFPFVFDFACAASDFRMIDDWRVPVLIPFDERARDLIRQLRNPDIPLRRDLLRGLQRYIVQIPPRLLGEQSTAFESLREGQFHALISPELHYSRHCGLLLDPEHSSAQLLIA